MKAPRAPLFLLERLISQGGGLLFTAILVRTAEADEAAGFLAAYAFAAVFQPILSSAVQPIVARHWNAGGLAAVVRIWAVMQIVALCLIGPLIWLADGKVEAFLLLHAALAPGLLMATPLAAEDRRWKLVLILIGAATLGTTTRISVYLVTSDLALAAVFFSFEAVVGGAAFLLASRGLSHPSRPAVHPRKPYLQEASIMALAMGATALFWRSPVLLADAFLPPEDIIAMALAMQIVMGLCLPANALCQSLFGPLARGDRSALGLGVWIAVAIGIGAPALMVVAGDAIMTVAYGPLGAGAISYAVMLAPMAGLAALWRLGHIAGGLKGLSKELALTRAAALAGQGGLLIGLCIAPSGYLIAAITPLAMIVSAIIAPCLVPGLAGLAREAVTSARVIAFRAAGRRRAIRLMFS